MRVAALPAAGLAAGAGAGAGRTAVAAWPLARRAGASAAGRAGAGRGLNAGTSSGAIGATGSGEIGGRIGAPEASRGSIVIRLSSARNRNTSSSRSGPAAVCKSMVQIR